MSFCINTPDYSVHPHRVPHFFDLQDGRLLVGESAYADALQKASDPTAIRALGSLLTDQSVQIDQTNYQELDVDHWTKGKYLKFGRWLHLVVTSPDESCSNLTETVIERAYHLGLGPYQNRITAPSRFGSLANFYSSLEITPKYSRGQYDRWSYDQFVNYLVELLITKPAELTLSDFVSQNAKDKTKPTLRIIRGHVGNLLPLLAERGYPNIRAWSRDDYIDWGVAFMHSNNGIRPKRDSINSLSAKWRGPSTPSVYNHFGSLTDYQEEVRLKYEASLESMECRLNGQAKQLRAAKRGKFVLLSAMQAQYTPPWLGVRMASQYFLMEALHIPGMSPEKNEVVATLMRQREYEANVQRLSPGITRSQIRALARNKGLEEDIWPKHNPEYLYVPAA